MGYTKQNFTSGQTLTAAHLNTMEDGIASIASATIPTYWQAHMDTKISEINAMNELGGGDTDSFIFITDLHLPRYNNNDNVALIKYIIENTSVQKVFFGGDVVHATSDASGMESIRGLDKSLKNVKTHMMRGNHDSDVNTKQQFYDAMYRKQSDYCEMTSKLYYYTDNKPNKIRYIVMDSVYTSSNPVMTDTTQLSWMKDRITELDNDWTVIIFRHSIWEPAKKANSIGDINADANLVLNALNEISSNTKCTVAGIIAGHCHRDYSGTADNGLLLIATTCDANGTLASNYDPVSSNRTAGTTSAQAFDVVNVNPITRTIKLIRIGAGSNREFTY